MRWFVVIDCFCAVNDSRVHAALRDFPRQALHAARLALRHPLTGRELQWQAALPQDMQQLLAALEAARA